MDPLDTASFDPDLDEDDLDLVQDLGDEEGPQAEEEQARYCNCLLKLQSIHFSQVDTKPGVTIIFEEHAEVESNPALALQSGNKGPVQEDAEEEEIVMLSAECGHH